MLLSQAAGTWRPLRDIDYSLLYSYRSCTVHRAAYGRVGLAAGGSQGGRSGLQRHSVVRLGQELATQRMHCKSAAAMYGIQRGMQ